MSAPLLSDQENQKRLKTAWAQKTIPVVLRRGGPGENIRVRLPYAKNNKLWLRNNRTRKPSWNQEHKCWELPKAWFNDLVDRSLQQWGQIYIIQPYREQEICAPACMNAKGHDCQCSCMGANHGQGDDGNWFSTSEAFAAKWGEKKLACRLMKVK